MSRLRAAALLLAALLALIAIQRTMPDYAMLRGPVLRHAAVGEAGQGMGFTARLTGLTVTPEVVGEDYKGPVSRTTGGIWLIAHLRLAADGAAQDGAALPSWRSATGRVYAPSRRPGIPLALLVRAGQAERDAVAIFELPALSEVTGGTLALGSAAIKSFDTELRLDSTGLTPVQVAQFDTMQGGGS